MTQAQIDLRAFAADDAATWRTIRLEALANAPEAFWSGAGACGKATDWRLSPNCVWPLSAVCRVPRCQSRWNGRVL